MKKILFIAAHRKNRSPSQRFRFEQYFKFLESRGYHCDLSPLISQKDDALFYSAGNIVAKIIILIKNSYTRWKDVKRANNYDLIFIQREAFFAGTTFFERQLKKKKPRLVFDFDDAIWNRDVSSANKTFGWLKDPRKTEKLIALCDLIIAGNNYLADYAKEFNQNVIVIPTTIDTEEYVPDKKQSQREHICIGWSGSITTIKHFEYAIPFLNLLKKKYGEKIRFKVIGDPGYENTALGIKGVAWTMESELRELNTFDIGIMPLPNDSWSKGKCGLKGLQYMALEIPAVMSPVGVNVDIVVDGINGYLADSEDEWLEKISHLIDSQELRIRIGKAARETVVKSYSVESQKHNYLCALEKLIC